MTAQKQPSDHHFWRRRLKHAGLWIVLACIIAGAGVTVLWESPPEKIADGIFWQPNRECIQPEGIWNQIGIRTLVIQWMVTDGRAWFPSKKLPEWAPQPDWTRINEAPWAKNIIVGLAGDFLVHSSRINAKQLAALSPDIIHDIPIKNTIAWYAPVEISPNWHDSKAIREYLAKLPHPLWITIYGGENMKRKKFVSWIQSWLPPHVGILYQDGVGEGRETPAQAARRVRALESAFGRSRVGIILEAFKSEPNGRFVPAGIWRIARQLRTYRGLSIFIFSVKTLGVIDVLLLKFLGLIGYI